MREGEPGRVSSERDARAVPVNNVALVVGEDGRGEKVDEERHVARRARLHGHHVGRVTRVVELVWLEALLLALLRTALRAFDPAELAVLGDEPVAMVALVERDDDEVLCRRRGTALLVALLDRVGDEALGKADHEGIVGALAPSVEEEGNGDIAGGLVRLDRRERV